MPTPITRRKEVRTVDEEYEEERERIKPLPRFGIDRLLPFLRPYRKKFLFMVLLGLAGSAVDIILPLFQKYAISHFIAEGVLDTLLPFILLYLLVLTVQIFANTISTYRASEIEILVNRDLKRAVFDHLQTLSFSYFNQNSVGYVHARVMSDPTRIGELVAWGLIDGVWHISYIVGALAVMFVLRPSLAALVCVVIPFTALFVILFQKKLVGVNRSLREINARITGNFNEGITGAKTVKSLVIEDGMQEVFDRDAGEMKRTAVRATRLRSFFSSVVTFSSSIALALVLWRGGFLTMEQVIDVGTLSVFMNYALGIMEPISWLVDEFSNLITAQVNIERVTSLLDTKSDVADTPEVIEKYGDNFTAKRENWEPLEGEIDFDDVSFRYPDGDETVLSHFSLHVPKGTNVAIVGETGAGKSTLVNLVCRFFEPTEGRILIDGRDARERSQLWLHSGIGYVLQTPFLFTGTVRDNLRYGNPKADDKTILAALDRVSARGIVERMEKGLDSEVGEGGDLLSAGEKQLLSFARALLAEPKILVLDEATSSVDTVTECAIQQAIAEVTKGRTSFVIAHRLSTVRSADVILAVRDGKIVERGTHDSLMEKKGYYYELYTRQYEEEETASLL